MVGTRPGNISDIIAERRMAKDGYASVYESQLTGFLKDAVMVDKYSANGVHFLNLYFEGAVPPHIYRIMKEWNEALDFPFFKKDFQEVEGETYGTLNIAPRIAERLYAMRDAGDVQFALAPRRSFVPLAMEPAKLQKSCTDFARETRSDAMTLVFDKTIHPKDATAYLVVPITQASKIRSVIDKYCPESAALEYTASPDARLSLKMPNTTALTLKGSAIPFIRSVLPRDAQLDVSSMSFPEMDHDSKALAFMQACALNSPFDPQKCRGVLQSMRPTAKGCAIAS
ncbi:MAG: hypothetical protein CMM93_06565 [Rickettsiales bacterium]|nr:hypothetical protein [Rickettsiales bacterium]